MTCPVSRPVNMRVLTCMICDAPLPCESTTSPHPEAPELVRFVERPWLGFMAPDVLIVCCSKACADVLLEEG